MNTSNQSATQRAYLRLRRDIIAGDLAPGVRLKVDDLKGKLNTGASPVREALSLLTSDQLVERLDQRGFRVARASREQFNEVLNLRCNLETLALKESIKNCDDAWEEMLVLSHHRLNKSDRADQDAFETCHKDFHMALIANCKSPILLKFCSQLYDLNVRYRYLAGTSKGYGQREVAREHSDILQAAVARDYDACAERLVSHYRQTGAFLADLIE